MRPSYVVTAAHCTIPSSKNVIIVHGGTPSRNMYVAVLKLSSPMVGPNIKPIFLYQRKVPDNTMVVTGWGLTNKNNKYPTNQLRKVTVRTVNK